MIGTRASREAESQEPEGGFLPEAGGVSACIQVNWGRRLGRMAWPPLIQHLEPLSKHGMGHRPSHKCPFQ